MTTSSKYIGELQSIRGLAALGVLAGHSLGYWIEPGWVVELKRFAINGHGFVVIFFVLSGYVLGNSLRTKKIDTGTVGEFYVRRLFRIYPAIWTASLLALAYLTLLHWQFPVPGTSEAFQHRFQEGRMGLIYIVASFAGLASFLLPPLWSITVELINSAVLPFFSLLGRKSKYGFWALFLVALAFSVTIGTKGYYVFGAYFVDFMAGLSILFISPEFAARLKAWRFRYFAAALFACALLAARSFQTFEQHAAIPHMIELVSAWSIIGLVAIGAVRPPFLKLPAMVYLGDISYSIYLLHYPVLCIVAKAEYFLLGQANVTVLAVSLALATALATIALSSLQYRYVELKGMEAGRAFLQGLRVQRQLKPL